MAILIKTDGVVAIVRPANKKFTLDELQGYVGGLIELVHTHRAIIKGRNGPSVGVPNNADMYINEEGKILGLPINSVATALYCYGESDSIVGDAVVINDAREQE